VGPNGAIGVNFLGRVVISERIERSIERKKRRLVGKFGGDRSQTRTWSKRELSLLYISMQTGLIQSNQTIAYTISCALFDCVSAYSLTRLTVWAKKGVVPPM
jgi:hypothetical protein